MNRYIAEAKELEKRWLMYKPRWNFWLESRRKKTLMPPRFSRAVTAVMLEGQRLMNEKSLD
tara:strand:- start:445 stop:627 length:183 start_codon:yes stop_codon:yes gene_type:complete